MEKHRIKLEDILSAVEKKEISFTPEGSNESISIEHLHNPMPTQVSSEITINGEMVYFGIEKICKRHVLLWFILISGLFLLIYILLRLILFYYILEYEKGWEVLEKYTYILNEIFGVGLVVFSVGTYIYLFITKKDFNPLKPFNYLVEKRKEKMWKRLVDTDSTSYVQIKNKLICNLSETKK